MVTLLMTRTRDASERFVAALRRDSGMDLRVVLSPLIDIVPVTSELETAGAKGIVFTSANGVRVASTLTTQRHLPCFCVGEATAAAARHAGWPADCVGRNADELVAALLDARPAAPLVHLRGVNTRGDIAQRLTSAGLGARDQAIYDQPLQPLSPEAEEVLKAADPVVVPLFSPRVARHFASLAHGSAPLYLAAISAAAADPLKSLNFNLLEVAERPTAEAMSQAVAQALRRANRLVSGSGPQ